MLTFIDGSLEFRGSSVIIGTSLVMTEDANGVPRLDSTAGGGATDLDGLSDVTVSAPATRHVLVHNGGSLFVNRLLVEADVSDLQSYLLDITGEPLSTLSDVTISAIASGELLEWNGSLWRNRTFAELGILTDITGEPLSSLSDVTITAIGSGELLEWSGSAWLNRTLAEIGIADTSHTHPLSALSDVTITAIAADELLQWTGSAWINRTRAEANLLRTDISGTINVAANATTVLTLGESSTTRGNSQDSIIEFWGEDSSALARTTISQSGTNFQFRWTSGTVGNFQILDGMQLRIYDTGNTDYASFVHNGTDFNTAFVSTAIWNVTGLTNAMRVYADLRVLDGNALRVNDSGNTDWGEWTHDTTDFNLTFTNTADYNITGLTNALKVDQTIVSTKTLGSATAILNLQQGYIIYSDNTGSGASNTRMWFESSVDAGEMIFGPRSGSFWLDQIRCRTRRFEIEGETGFVAGSAGAAQLDITNLDVRMHDLGVFDHTATPSSDQSLSYNGSKWVPRSIASSFPSGDVVSGNVGDGTSVAYVDDGRTLSGATPTPAPTTAPAILPVYKGVIVDMSAYSSLGANEAFDIYYGLSTAAGDPTTTPGDWQLIIDRSTADHIVHDGLQISPTVETYKWIYRISAGTNKTAWTPTSANTQPLDTPNVMAFGIILASQLAVVKLSAVTATFGAGFMDSLTINLGGNILNKGDMVTLGSSYFRNLQVDALSTVYGEDATEAIRLLGGEFTFRGRQSEIKTPIAITAVDVGNPTTIHAAAHGGENGDRVYIQGHTGAIPDINGFHIISNKFDNTFDIPVNVTTSGGSSGTATMSDRSDNTLMGNYAVNRGGSQAVHQDLTWANNNPSVTTANTNGYIDAGTIPDNDVDTANQPANDNKYKVRFNITLDSNITSSINFVDTVGRVTIQWRENAGAGWRTWGTQSLWGEAADFPPISQNFTVTIDTTGITVTAFDVRLTYAATVHAQKVITGSVTVSGGGSAGEFVEFNYDIGGGSFSRRGTKYFQDAGEPPIYLEPILDPPTGANTATGELWFNGVSKALEYSNGVRAVTAGMPGRFSAMYGGRVTQDDLRLTSAGAFPVLAIGTGGALTGILGVQGRATQMLSGTTTSNGISLNMSLVSQHRSINGLIFEALILTPGTISNARYWIGFTSATQRTRNNNTALGSFIGFRWTGSGSMNAVTKLSSQTNTALAPLSINTYYWLRIVVDGNTKAVFTMNDATATHITNLPATTTTFFTELAVLPTIASNRGLIFNYVYVFAGS